MQQIKGTCDGTVARRLYVRNTHLSVDDLSLPRKYWKNKSSITQGFVPIGIICLNCCYTIGSPAAALGPYRKSGIHREVRKTLPKSLEDLKASTEVLETDLSKIPRAQRRRAQRSQEKLAEYRQQLNLKLTR